MAILITIFECDNCTAVAPLRTQADWLRFETLWWEGFKYQFCPNCCDKFETQARIIEDERMIQRLIENSEVELNAKFIS